MELFKLKREARQFFSESYKTQVTTLATWEAANIHPNLLEKAERICIEYGHQEGNATHLKGWANDETNPNTRINFSVIVNRITHEQYEKIKVDELMDELQNTASKYLYNLLD